MFLDLHFTTLTTHFIRLENYCKHFEEKQITLILLSFRKFVAHLVRLCTIGKEKNIKRASYEKTHEKKHEIF